MGGVLGGSKQKSSNQAYGTIQDATKDSLGGISSGYNALTALLGGDTSGLDAFKRNMGFDAMAEEGSRGITGNAAAGGLLRSGATGKALQSYGTDLNSKFGGDYMDRLLAQAGLGLQSGQLLAGAGQKSSSKSKKGLGSTLGALGSIGALGPVGAVAGAAA